MAPSAVTTLGLSTGDARTMSPLGLVNMAYGCRPPSVNAGKKCAMVMASWDHGSRECLRLVCVSSSFFFSSSSIFFRISSLPLGAFGSFLPPFSFAAAAAAAFSFSWAARTSGSTMGGGSASAGYDDCKQNTRSVSPIARTRIKRNSPLCGSRGRAKASRQSSSWPASSYPSPRAWPRVPA